ncbi:MAG: Na+/H+ antiporter subunit C [Cyclobacteriaceae bacterium]|nr:Na+/H+ antiporter subunit C [Cyclobacteriaceae bacterium]MCH8516418.1 Na+/H+ antiporter subunit C [Cyclobacteriaceae bacterium]
MEIVLPFVVGFLFTSGVYLMMHRNFIKIILGMALLGYAGNLFLFVISRITLGQPAFIPSDAEKMGEVYADPFPQALILTAIVIGFGVQAFAIILLKRTYINIGTANLDELKDED